MPSGPRYHQLAAEDERPSTQVPLVADEALPTYDVSASNSTTNKTPAVFVLPSYEEVQQMKRQHNTERNDASATQAVTEAEQVLGTDAGFILSFFVAFLLNGLGFLCAFCMSQTYAGRFGATSGFGLAMVKIAAIMYHVYAVACGKNDADGTQDEDTVYFFGFYRPNPPPADDVVSDMMVADASSTSMAPVADAVADATETMSTSEATESGELTAFFYQGNDDFDPTPEQTRAQMWFTALLFFLGLLLFFHGILAYVRMKNAVRRGLAGL